MISLGVVIWLRFVQDFFSAENQLYGILRFNPRLEWIFFVLCALDALSRWRPSYKRDPASSTRCWRFSWIRYDTFLWQVCAINCTSCMKLFLCILNTEFLVALLFWRNCIIATESSLFEEALESIHSLRPKFCPAEDFKRQLMAFLSWEIHVVVGRLNISLSLSRRRGPKLTLLSCPQLAAPLLQRTISTWTGKPQEGPWRI